MKEIYLDHAATTRVDDRVVAKMLPYFTEVYGNPNSQHGYGRNAQEAVDEARDTLQNLSARNRAKFISLRAVPKATTGRYAERVKRLRARVNT